MGLFKGVGGADRPITRLPFLKDGQYVVRIDEVVVFKARNKGEMVKANMTVLAVRDPGETGDPPGHRVGEQVCWLLMPEWDLFLTNMRGMIECAFRCDFSEMSEEAAEKACEDATSNAQPLAGTICEVHGSLILTKGEGKPFTAVRWMREIDPRTLGEEIGDEAIAKVYPGKQIEELMLLCQMRDEEEKASV